MLGGANSTQTLLSDRLDVSKGRPKALSRKRLNMKRQDTNYEVWDMRYKPAKDVRVHGKNVQKTMATDNGNGNERAS